MIARTMPYLPPSVPRPPFVVGVASLLAGLALIDQGGAVYRSLGVLLLLVGVAAHGYCLWVQRRDGDED